MADYKIKRKDIKDSSKLMQDKMRVLRIQIVKIIESSSRDFEGLQIAVDQYIEAFKTNDYILGYAEIEGDEK